MIKITFNKKTYKGIYRWEEMTLGKFSELAAIPMPDGYESFIIADSKFTTETLENYITEVNKLTDQQINEDFPTYYRQVIACLSNVPVDKLSPEQVNDLYELYFKPFVLSLIYHTPVIYFMGQITKYEPQSIKWFRIGINRYYLPKTVNVMGQEITLAKEPAITYSEACDVFRGMKITRDTVTQLALFMGIYCRKKKEKYSEDKALKRQRIFMKSYMSVVWSVFFYTVRRLPDYTIPIQLFGSLPKSLKEIVQRVRDLQNTGTEAYYTSVPDMVD